MATLAKNSHVRVENTQPTAQSPEPRAREAGRLGRWVLQLATKAIHAARKAVRRETSGQSRRELECTGANSFILERTDAKFKHISGRQALKLLRPPGAAVMLRLCRSRGSPSSALHSPHVPSGPHLPTPTTPWSLGPLPINASRRFLHLSSVPLLLLLMKMEGAH